MAAAACDANEFAACRSVGEVSRDFSARMSDLSCCFVILWEGFVVTDYLKCFEDCGIGKIGVFHGVLSVENVADDVARQETFEEGVARDNHEIAALCTALVGKGGKLLNIIMRVKETAYVLVVAALAEFGTVLIDEVVSKSCHLPIHQHFAEVAGITDGVARNEIVGNDATTSVYGSSETGFELLAVGLDAVGIVVFACFGSLKKVVFIGFFVARGVGFLHTTS